jgi:hypothetical protein
MSGIVGIMAASASRTLTKAADVSTQNYCYWRKDMIATCSGGTRYERWCYICNDPGTGLTTYKCEWRPDGPC